jgi:STE24 endopeptidase
MTPFSMTPLCSLLIFYLLTRAVAMGLVLLNRKHQTTHGHKVPAGFEGEIDQPLLARMRDYSLALSRLGLTAAGFDLLVVLIFIFGGLLDWYNGWIASKSLPPLVAGLLFFLLLAYARILLHLPFDLYRTFVIEQQYGFNTQNWRLWSMDLLKSLLLTTILTSLLLAVSLWLIAHLPTLWWLAVWLLILAFTTFLLYLAPYVLEPLFNTFTPINDQELAGQIGKMAKKAGISVSKILIMDASRRSTHSNAYFSGIGHVKRIILYDTLLAKNSRDEIIAILAHEAGHWRKKHLLKRMFATQAIALAGSYLIFLLVRSGLLLDWFAIQQVTLYSNLLLAGFLTSLISFPLVPLTNFLSRRHELEADEFAVRLTGNPSALAGALTKLASDNLANLHPHPWYAAFYYSHDPLPRRVERLLARPPRAT